jgi:adenylate kinase family enzyme
MNDFYASFFYYVVFVLRFVHFSSGDLLRKEVLSGSKRGMQIYRLMELGELVPTVSLIRFSLDPRGACTSTRS